MKLTKSADMRITHRGQRERLHFSSGEVAFTGRYCTLLLNIANPLLDKFMAGIAKDRPDIVVRIVSHLFLKQREKGIYQQVIRCVSVRRLIMTSPRRSCFTTSTTISWNLVHVSTSVSGFVYPQHAMQRISSTSSQNVSCLFARNEIVLQF